MGWLIDLMDAISDSDIDAFSSIIKNLSFEEKKKLRDEKILEQLWFKAGLVYNRIYRNNEYVKIYKPPSEQELASNRTFPDPPTIKDITPISQILFLLANMGAATSITYNNYKSKGINDNTIEQLNKLTTVPKHIKDKALVQAIKNIYELRTKQNSDLGPAQLIMNYAGIQKPSKQIKPQYIPSEENMKALYPEYFKNNSNRKGGMRRKGQTQKQKRKSQKKTRKH